MRRLPPDSVYQKTRAELLGYERGAFAALRAGVPNCYRDAGASTAWGWILYSLACQIQDLDSQDHYFLESADPYFLTPPDLLRDLVPFLPVGRNYPSLGQSDAEFREMVLGLVEAFRMGARLPALGRVIQAFTGVDSTQFSVTEMFKQIGSEGVDVSYRNTVRIEVPMGTQLTQSRDLLQDVYRALQKVKAAHVGIDLVGKMPFQDSFEDRILGITDEFTITFLAQDGVATDELLKLVPSAEGTMSTTLAPDKDPSDLTYRWYRDGVDLGVTTSTLQVTAALSAVPHRYSVHVTDPELGEAWSKQIPLNVVADEAYAPGAWLPSPPPPTTELHPSTGVLVVSRQPMARTVFEGDVVTLDVEVSNSLKAGSLAPGMDRSRFLRTDALSYNAIDELEFVEPGFAEDGMFHDAPIDLGG